MKMQIMAMVGALALVLVGVAARSVVLPDLPGNLNVPEGEKVLIQAHAKGVQTYTCSAGADQKYS